MKRVLIIGGTGMLSGVSDYFISEGSDVTIVGRNNSRLEYFRKKHPGKVIDLLSSDYSNAPVFLDEIRSRITKYGCYDVVICWIHSYASDTLVQLLDLICTECPSAKFFHVKGSSSVSNSFEFDNLKEYHRIVLGFKVIGNKSRWLTNEEISDGVLKAYKSGEKGFIVGQIEPVELRPK